MLGEIPDLILKFTDGPMDYVNLNNWGQTDLMQE